MNILRQFLCSNKRETSVVLLLFVCVLLDYIIIQVRIQKHSVCWGGGPDVLRFSCNHRISQNVWTHPKEGGACNEKGNKVRKKAKNRNRYN